MIWNIIDERKRPYRWKAVNAMIESVWHDNSCEDSDKAEPNLAREMTYEERRGVSLREAIVWAQGIDADVTLYIYDEGSGV